MTSIIFNFIQSCTLLYGNSLIKVTHWETYNGPFQHDTLGDKVLAKFWSCKKAVQCISFTKIVSQIFNI